MTEATQKLDRFAAAAEANKHLGALNERMGVYFTEFAAERSVAKMPVEGNTQPLGLLHGGAHLVLAETMGSILAHYHAGPGRFAVGIEISASHTRSVTEGEVTGVCTPIHLGGSMTVHQVEISDAEGNRLSTVRITNLIRNHK
ncbi:MAG: hotdog fold thioesterase [Microbacteriaceae bacterium]